MNKADVKRVLGLGKSFLEMFNAETIETVTEGYEELRDSLQEKIDRLESMENLGDANSERLDTYYERMEQLEGLITLVETFSESVEEFESGLNDFEAE